MSETKTQLNIFVLEDDPNAIGVAGFLEARGHKVWRAEELASAVYRFEYDPGIDHFDCLLFDLSLPARTVRHRGDRGTVSYGDVILTGLDFIIQNHSFYLREPIEKNALAILTAFSLQTANTLAANPEYQRILRTVPVIKKTDDDFLEGIEKFLANVVKSL